MENLMQEYGDFGTTTAELYGNFGKTGYYPSEYDDGVGNTNGWINDPMAYSSMDGKGLWRAPIGADQDITHGPRPIGTDETVSSPNILDMVLGWDRQFMEPRWFRSGTETPGDRPGERGTPALSNQPYGG